MPKNAMPIRFLLALVVAVMGILAPAVAAQASPATTDRLVLSWAPDGKQLRVDGYGYRPQDTVDVGLGSDPIQRAQADGTGRVRVTVPEQFVGAGQSGTSIIVTGRSGTGAARVLISAIPPRAAVRGPVDVLPWSIGAALAGIVVIGAVVRRRSRRA